MLLPKQKQLLLTLVERGSIPVTEIKGLSTATIYKHLSRLESLRVQNTRGVLRLTTESDSEPRSSIERRRRVNRPLKAGVARYIVGRLARKQSEGGSCGPIFLDCGSACAEIGREIVSQRAPDCRIVTINPIVFGEFGQAPDFSNLSVLPGEVDWNKGSILTSVGDINSAVFNVAIIGTDLAFADAQLGQATATGIDLKLAAMKKACEVFFPVDQSKLRPAPEIQPPHLLSFEAGHGCVVVGVDQTWPAGTQRLLRQLKTRASDSQLEVVAVAASGRPIEI